MEAVDIVLDFSMFNYSTPQYCEQTVLEPQIQRHGVTVQRWFRFSKNKKTGEIVRAALLSNEQLILYSYYS
jgi:hypothetical protein